MKTIVLHGVRFYEIFSRIRHVFCLDVLHITRWNKTGFSLPSIILNTLSIRIPENVSSISSITDFRITKNNTPWLILLKVKLSNRFYDVNS